MGRGRCSTGRQTKSKFYILHTPPPPPLVLENHILAPFTELIASPFFHTILTIVSDLFTPIMIPVVSPLAAPVDLIKTFSLQEISGLGITAH